MTFAKWKCMVRLKEASKTLEMSFFFNLLLNIIRSFGNDLPKICANATAYNKYNNSSNVIFKS